MTMTLQHKPLHERPIQGEAEATLRFQVRLSPSCSVPGFYARVSGGKLNAPMEFSSKDAFVLFLEHLAEHGPNLK